MSNQKTGLIYGVKLNGNQKIGYSYDDLVRVKTRTINTSTPFVTEYGYLEGVKAGTTTTLIKTIKNGNDTLEYAYDVLGNITQIKKNGTVVESYTYDNLNQLKTVTRGADVWEYTYDNGGNILSVTKNGTAIKTYGYTDTEWKDKMTVFNGQTITYDDIGNPLQYRDGYNFTWSNGRQLTGVINGTNSYSYAYNADGLRTSKTVNGTTTNYYWANGVLQAQKTGDEYIVFLYDENGSAYGLLLKNGTTEEYYYYIYNAQGDVIGILNSAGTQVVSYEYGAWGEILSVTGTMADTIGQKNPLRYRGYYYDAETGFYLTGTRYYDPEIGRFINADGYVSTGQGILGTNMFAYCGNNPVNRADPTGTFWKKVGNFFKNVGTAIYNGAKKVVKAAVGSFQIEVGVGYGLGASAKVGPVKVAASAYQDGLTVGLKNGSTYTAIKGGAGISAQITKNASVGLSTEYEHRFETDLVRDWDEHTTMSAPREVYNCPKTVKDPLQFSFLIVKPIEGNLSQGLFIGISAEAHIGVGGHFTIGWDATEFWRILTE